MGHMLAAVLRYERGEWDRVASRLSPEPGTPTCRLHGIC